MPTVSPLSRIRSRLAHPRLPVIGAWIAVLLSLPALWQGLRADDFHHRAAILGTGTGGYGLRGDIASLYSFVDGKPEHTLALGGPGHVPWWSDPEARLSFFRPLSAFFLKLDYRLWPGNYPIMHAHSLLWLFGVVLAAGLFYRKVCGSDALAGLAILLFAGDDAHAVPAVWLAQRNTLLAMFFGIAALLAHHRSRADDGRPGKAIGPALYVFALLAGEAGVTTLAYLVAYALFRDPGPGSDRARSLLPFLGITVVWRLGTHLAGYGTAHVDFYIDPGSEPLKFLGAVAFRLPILFLGLFSPIDSTGGLLGPPGTAELFCGLGLATMAFVGAGVWPLLRRDPRARFFALGTILSLIPSCATFPGNRMLMWSSLGAMGLIACFLEAWFDPRPSAASQAAGSSPGGPGRSDPTELPGGRAYRLLAGPLAFSLLVVHLVVAPIQKPLAVAGNQKLRAQIYLRLQDDPSLAGGSVVVVNEPVAFYVSHFPVMQAAAGLPVPAHMRVLAPSFAAVELERPDERTLIVRPAGGWVLHPFDALYTSARRPVPVGYQVRYPDLTIEVRTLTPDGRPAEISCRFRAALEDASLHWFFWENGGFRPWVPPAIGGRQSLPPAAPVM